MGEVVFYYMRGCGFCHRLMERLDEEHPKWSQELGLKMVETTSMRGEYMSYTHKPRGVPAFYFYPDGKDSMPSIMSQDPHMGSSSEVWTYPMIYNWVNQHCGEGMCNAMTRSGHHCRNSVNCRHHQH